MAATMACPRCGGDIEYEVERASDGDGPWAQSGWVGIVGYEEVPRAFQERDGRRLQTDCGCLWNDTEMEQLDWEATKRAAEGPSEP